MDEHTEFPAHSGRLMHLLAYVYLEHHREDKAIVLMQAVEALGQADSRALALLALAQRKANQPEQALLTLDRIVPDTVDAALAPVLHLIRAQALQALDRSDEAYQSMQAYIGGRSRTSATHHKEPF